MRATSSFSSFPDVAFETAPTFVVQGRPDSGAVSKATLEKLLRDGAEGLAWQAANGQREVRAYRREGMEPGDCRDEDNQTLTGT